jgi:hypothetical protein
MVMAQMRTASVESPHPSEDDPHVRRVIIKSVARLRLNMRDLFNSYHPERYYMRGPGPKWREKHPA